MPGAQHTGMCELLRTLRSGRLVNGCSTIPPQYVARQEFHQLFILLRTALNPMSARDVSGSFAIDVREARSGPATIKLVVYVSLDGALSYRHAESLNDEEGLRP